MFCFKLSLLEYVLLEILWNIHLIRIHDKILTWIHEMKRKIVIQKENNVLVFCFDQVV